MKGAKLFTLDVEIIDNLSKEDNMSLLVNNLLTEYYSSNKVTKEQLQSQIKKKEVELLKIQEEITNLNTQLKSLIEKENNIKELYKDIPKNILLDFRDFPLMTEDVLRIRYKNIYSKNYPDLSFEKIHSTFKHYFKDRKEEEI